MSTAEEIPVDCPSCKAQFSITMSQTVEIVSCPHCGVRGQFRPKKAASKQGRKPPRSNGAAKREIQEKSARRAEHYCRTCGRRVDWIALVCPKCRAPYPVPTAFLFLFVVVAIVSCLVCIGLLSTWDEAKQGWRAAEREQSRLSRKALDYEIVQTTPDGANMLVIKVKITNKIDRRVRSALVACVVLDRQEREIASQGHYIVRSLDGGLQPGASKYFDYVVDVPVADVGTVTFRQIEIDIAD